MTRVNFLALAVITVIVFIASSIWYSPILFGRQFLALSGTAGNSQPNALKALCELLRTFILAYVIARLILGLNIADWKDALGLGPLAVAGLSCHSANGLNALAERALATGSNPCR